MPSHGLKSDTKHPYMKKAHPFWRHPNLPPTLGYSQSTVEDFERKKEAFDQSAKFISWTRKENTIQ